MRSLATAASTKHLKYKVVDNVAVVTVDSPGVKVYGDNNIIVHFK